MLPAAEQEVLLQRLDGFQLNGRVSVRGGASDFIATLVWRQRDARAEVQLSGPLGAGSLRVEFGPAGLRVANSRGDELEGDEASRFIESQLGFDPPFEALRYWVLGLAAPDGQPAETSTDAEGRIAGMTQAGWKLGIDRWSAVPARRGQVRVPQRLVATNGSLKLTVFVDRWKLREGT